jgi:hypothetical protein
MEGQTSTVINAISTFSKVPIFSVSEKDESTFRAVAAPNGDIFTLSYRGKLPRLFLTHYSGNAKVKELELWQYRQSNPFAELPFKGNITINKNGNIIVADPVTLIFINENLEMLPVFLYETNDIFRNAFREIGLSLSAWHTSALTTNDKNEIIMVVTHISGKRFFSHFTSDGKVIGIYPINNDDKTKYVSIAAMNNILLSGTNGIDVYDKNFEFIQTLIPEKNVFFTIDSYNNIATIGNKEIKGYSPDGKLLIQKRFTIDNIYDFRSYPENHILILCSRGSTWGVPVNYKIAII